MVLVSRILTHHGDIRDEGIYSLEKGRTFYTSNAGLKELKD